MVWVIGIEDLVPDRLAAYAHRRDEAPLDAAVQLLAAQWERIDWEYLRQQAAWPAWHVVPALAQAEDLADQALRRAAGSGDAPGGAAERRDREGDA